MAVIKPFRAYRPAPENQSLIPALPYDVMSTEEARETAAGNPLSFLHVDKPEIDLPAGTDPYQEAVYQTAGTNLKQLEESGALLLEETPCFYLYRQIRLGRSQTGLVCCASIDDYLNNVIKKHELTRSDKEADRIRHVDACNANTGPIFLTYRHQPSIRILEQSWIACHQPIYHFTTPDNVEQQVWKIDDPAVIQKLTSIFQDIDSLYIADGHHRCAAAAAVGLKRREQNPDFSGKEAFHYFLAIAFPDSELEIMDYNRVVADLNGMSEADFLAKLNQSFMVEPAALSPYKPAEKHQFGMYLCSKWYALRPKDGTYSTEDPVAQLDVSILQNNLLEPILGIHDPKTDRRIDFVGGIRGLEELEHRADQTNGVAFAMYPTTIDDLMAIADAGKIMPPKSTWFEPKLLSGLFIHPLDE